MDWNHGNGSHGAYGFPHESSIHYFNGPSGEEDNGQDEGEVASGLNQCANGNTNLYETLIASQPRGNSSKIPGLHITTSESADKNANLEKAAKLREKLLASRRTGSRDVTPADNAKNTQLGANTSRPSQSRVPGLEELIREGREAAEKSAKQHGPLDVTQINVVEQQIDLASSAKPANNTKHQEHANGDMNVAPAAKVTISPMSNALEKARGTSDHGNVPHPGQAKNVQNVVDKRVPTAVRKDVGNDNHGVVSTVQSDRGVAHSHVDDAKGGVEETNGSVQLRPVKRLDGPLTNVSNDKVSAGFDPSILSNYFSDLSEWLEITGYHDLHLRQRTLNRHRRRLQLEQELAQLDQEDEEDRNIVSRSGPIGLLPAEPSSVTRTTGITSGSSAQPQRTARTAPSTGIADASASANLPSAPASDETHVRAKRPPSASSDVHRPEKQQRTEVNETSNMGNSLNRPSFRPPDNVAHARQPYSYSKRSQDDEHRRSTHENNYRLRYDPEYDRPTLKPSPHTWHVRASTADPFERDRYSEGGRSDPRAGAGSLFSSQRRFGNRRFNKSRGLTANVARNTLVKQPNTTNGKGNGATRYFLIKSWNHENVLTSQRDGIWATQPHNEGILVEAFKTSKRVILVFSVNKSMAFQGYARMLSLPGTAPPPQWTKQLLWKSSPPFNIQWITIAETRFSHTKHIKNVLNEGQPVLIGRDGQEIDEIAGRELCDLIDEYGKRFGSGGGRY